MHSISIAQPSPADLDIIHGFLSETYWSPGIPRDTVRRACAHSICAIARDDLGDLAGFARIISDHATFAWLADVFVLPAHRNKGVALALVRALMGHAELQGLRRWLLATRDAHHIYARLGFTPLGKPDRLMERRNETPYGAPAA